METFVDHVKKGKEFRTEADDAFKHAKKKYPGRLDFTAYRQGHDPMYLGINGKINYGKIWGQTSASIQSLLCPQAYWKRIYYRKRDPEDPDHEDDFPGPPIPSSSSDRGIDIPKTPSGTTTDIPIPKSIMNEVVTNGKTASTSSSNQAKQNRSVSQPNKTASSGNIISKNNNLKGSNNTRNHKPMRNSSSQLQGRDKLDRLLEQDEQREIERKKELATRGKLGPESDSYMTNYNKYPPKEHYPGIQVPESSAVCIPPVRNENALAKARSEAKKNVKKKIQQYDLPQEHTSNNSEKQPKPIIKELEVNDILEGMNADGSYSGAEEGKKRIEELKTMMEWRQTAEGKAYKKKILASLTPQDGFPFIRTFMGDECLSVDKPYYPKSRKNEPFNFFNTLGRENGKYCVRGVTNGNYNYSKLTHRTKNYETKYIASLSLRNDYNCITNDGIDRGD